MTSVRNTKEKGAALILFMLAFLAASLALGASVGEGVYADIASLKLLTESKQSYYAADAGVEDMAYRFIEGMSMSNPETLNLAGATVETRSTYDNIEGKYDLLAEADYNDVYQASSLELYTGSGASFNFGVQSGQGGFEMSNGSSVLGNVFSNGTIVKVGGGNATIYGDAISAGDAGLIEDIIATGTARARVIRDSTVEGDTYAYTLDGGLTEGDAYYFEKIGGATVYGNEYGHRPEQASTSLPITDEQIEAMKQDIIDNGTVIASTSPECAGGEYFTDNDLTLGFVKIECDFRIKKSGASTFLRLTGSIWVEGSVTFEGGPTVIVNSSVGARTVPIIADDPDNRTTGSAISVEQGTTFSGSGSPKSYIILISQNEDAENGGIEDAITLAQSSAGDLLVYAGHGRVSLGNSVSLKEITGYLISLGNSAEVIYESGLVNTLFTSGPGGGYTLGGWGGIY